MQNSPRREPSSREAPSRDTHSFDKTSQNNIQDVFLNNLRRDRTPVTLFLLGGVKLTGKIKSFDKYALILESGSQEQLIFKHAISTVVAARAPQPATPPSQAPEA